MNENGKETGVWKLVLGGVALIIVLFAGVKFVFWGLEQVIPKGRTDVSSGASVSQDVSEGLDAPSFCVHCGRELPESFQWGQFCPWCGEKNER